MPNSTKPSAICYVEIPSPDIEKAGFFYSSIFGWKVTESNLTDKAYWEFSTGEGQLSGGLDSSKKVPGEGVLLYLKVDDIDSVLTEITRAGGSILRPKFEIGNNYGYSALFSDPNGNTLGLFSTN